MTPRPDSAQLLPRSPLLAAGIPVSALTRVRSGAVVRTSEWEALFAEGRLRTLAHAVATRAANPLATFSHTTAAALHGIPVYRDRGDRVHLIVPGEHTRKDSRDVVRHHYALAESEVVVLAGLRATGLDRTVYDVIRTTPTAAAVVCFDAALRAVAWDEDSRTYDRELAERFRASILERIRRGTGARGIRQARFVTEFADGRAQLPGESVTRLWMYQLGIPRPELQYRVDLAGGRYALLDFAWPHLGRWQEFDGESKYTDPDLLAGRTAEQVLQEQQVREREVIRATGWSVTRHGFAQMPTLDAFAAYLRSIHLL